MAAWYLGLTAFALACAYIGRGLRRGHGVLIICAYLAFAGVVLATAYSSRVGLLLSIAVPAVVGIALAARLLRSSGGRAGARPGAEGNTANAEQSSTRRRSRSRWRPARSQMAAARPRRTPADAAAPGARARSITPCRLVGQAGLVPRACDQLADRRDRCDPRTPRHPDRAPDRRTLLRTAHRPLGTDRNRRRLGDRARGASSASPTRSGARPRTSCSSARW